MQTASRILFALACATAASLAAAGDRASIHYRIDADADDQRVRITCQGETTGGCVFLLGDPRSAAHKTLHLAPGATGELAPDDIDASYCASIQESRLAWPGCLGTPTSGVLRRSISVDYYFL